MHFKVNLTLVAILIIVLFFNIPFYNNWMNTNILGDPFSISAHMEQMDLEQRKINRFGYSYLIYKELTNSYEKAGIKNGLVLLPPEKFLKERGVNNITVAEPMVFYYLTGKKAVWYDSPDVAKANCVLLPDNGGRIVLRKINNADELKSLLDIFKQYKLDL